MKINVEKERMNEKSKKKKERMKINVEKERKNENIGRKRKKEYKER